MTDLDHVGIRPSRQLGVLCRDSIHQLCRNKRCRCDCHVTGTYPTTRRGRGGATPGLVATVGSQPLAPIRACATCGRATGFVAPDGTPLCSTCPDLPN